MESSHVPEQHTLVYEQVLKMDAILNRPVVLRSQGNFPTLTVTTAALVEEVRQRLSEKSVAVNSVRMNGSAASYCLCEEQDSEVLPPIHYNDVNIIFMVSNVCKQEGAVMKSLFKFFPKVSNTDKLSTTILEEAYAPKVAKVVTPFNRWSLISLGDGSDISIELKFVAAMK